jgi:YDG domain-containing protein
LAGLVGTESFTVTQTAGTYNSPNVATANTVSASLSAGDFTPSAGTLAGNYVLPTTASGPGHITAVTLTASIIGNPTKPYDGNTTAVLTTANYSLTGLVGTESISVSQTAGSYNSKDVVSANTVTASLTAGNFTAGTGTLLTNYVLPTTASGPGHITAVTLTASIIGNPTKPYDGNANAVLAPANFMLAGLVGTESFTVTQTAGTYNSPNVATANTVTASLSAGDFTPSAGTLAGNYVLPTTASGPGHITAVNATINVQPYSVLFDGNSHTATGTAKGVLNETLSGLDLSGTTHSNPGDYVADPWTFTDVTGNYNNANGTTHDSILFSTACSAGPGDAILPPINSDGSSVYQRRGGSTIPVKFRVCGANGVAISNASLVFGPSGGSITMLSAVRGTVDNVNEAGDNNIPDVAFRWDSSGQQWIFNMATTNLTSGSTYRFRINLANSSQSIVFVVGVK